MKAKPTQIGSDARTSRTTVSQYPEMIHGFFLMAGALDAGEKCINEVGAALADAFKGEPNSSPVPHVPK